MTVINQIRKRRTRAPIKERILLAKIMLMVIMVAMTDQWSAMKNMVRMQKQRLHRISML